MLTFVKLPRSEWKQCPLVLSLSLSLIYMPQTIHPPASLHKRRMDVISINHCAIWPLFQCDTPCGYLCRFSAFNISEMQRCFIVKSPVDQNVPSNLSVVAVTKGLQRVFGAIVMLNNGLWSGVSCSLSGWLSDSPGWRQCHAEKCTHLCRVNWTGHLVGSHSFFWLSTLEKKRKKDECFKLAPYSALSPGLIWTTAYGIISLSISIF